MTTQPQYAMIHYARWRDGAVYPLDIYREDLSGIGLPVRREQWAVLARDEQEAHRTVAYHFGHSALWYRLAAPEPRQAA